MTNTTPTPRLPKKIEEEFDEKFVMVRWLKDKYGCEIFLQEGDILTDALKSFLARHLAEAENRGYEKGKREMEKLKDALIWCSGSEDFQLEGKARKGWEKICQPLLKRKK